MPVAQNEPGRGASPLGLVTAEILAFWQGRGIVTCANLWERDCEIERKTHRRLAADGSCDIDIPEFPPV